MSKPYNKSSSKIIILLLLLLSGLISCIKKSLEPPIVVNDNVTDTPDSASSDALVPTETQEALSSDVYSLIHEDGTTLETRFNAPKGFTRIPSAEGDLTSFIRGLPLKKAGSDVLLYNGSPKAYQDGHAAVFDMDIGTRDLQQCADSVMRIYAEHYWSIKAYDKIAFHLTNGFLMEYTKWRDGNRLVVDGNDVSWSRIESYDDSYECFHNYLFMVFAYAGTLSLSKESNPITPEEILPGDMFLQGGSPGHCVLVVDVAKDSDGNKCFLLAQGYMPAQDFHVLKNPLHPNDPWYYVSELTYPLETPLWSFDEGSLVRWENLLPNATQTSLAIQGYTGGGPSPDSDDVFASFGNLPTKGSSTVKLLAVGDNLIHIQVINSGKQSDGSLNYDHLYSNVKDMISAADIAVVNQETILGGDKFPYSGYPNFNSPVEIGSALIHAGFDVILQATNHTMDMGLEGVKNTVAFWEQYPDIVTLGINETKEESEQITVIEKNGIKLAMLNYTYSLNGHSVPDNMPYLVNMLDKKKMAEDIKKAEDLADFTIVFPHWGTEYAYEPSKKQKEYTEFFYEQGVDLVIGSHPHVLEPVEWIESEEGRRMLVYYSLGNFLSYQKEAPRMLGGIAEVTITKDDTGTYISEAGIVPIVTHYENGPADYNYAIYKLTDYNEELANLHGVSEIAQKGPLTYQGIFDLAKQILGDWFQE